MNEENRKGRNWRAKYLTRDEFTEWRDNHFAHLIKDVRLNRKLLFGILFATVAVPTVFMIVVVQLLAR